MVRARPGVSAMMDALGAMGGAGSMRIGRWDVRPLGGGLGCLVMIVVSVVASIVLTVLLNLLFRG
jgi:hypothetical protein